jgi:O-antigen ligase
MSSKIRDIKIFKKRELKIKKPTGMDLLFIVFLIMVFFIPYTKLGINAIGKYELTLGDLSLMVLTSLIIYFKIGMRSAFIKFYAILLLFTFVCISTIVMSKSFEAYILSLVPFAFSLLISYSTLAFFSYGNLKSRALNIKTLLIIALVISAIPVYVQAFTGIKNDFFYDDFGWRYAFLCQNPNQYGVYFLLFFFLITQITLKFERHRLGNFILFSLLFFVPALFSGSKSTTLIFAINFFALVGLYILGATPVKKFSIAAGTVIILALTLQPILNFAKSNGGPVKRALSIFDKVSSGDLELHGATGRTINEAKELAMKYPILGVGLGNKKAYTGSATEVHNTFYKFLSESGVIGFSLFILLYCLTPLYALFSKDRLDYKLAVFLIFIMFAALNVPAMLFRQRWVWLFMCISFVLINVDENGDYRPSRFTLFN